MVSGAMCMLAPELGVWFHAVFVFFSFLNFCVDRAVLVTTEIQEETVFFPPLTKKAISQYPLRLIHCGDIVVRARIVHLLKRNIMRNAILQSLLMITIVIIP